MPSSRSHGSSRRANAIGVGALALVAALLWLCLRITDQEMWQHAPLGFMGLYPARLILLGLAALVMVAAFAGCVVRPPRARWVKRTWSAVFATAMTLLGLEAVFMFVPRSHNVGYTLASDIWFDYHWQLKNSLGYRDREHVREPGKRLVFAVGDSFTAGHGTVSPASRYTDLLNARHAELQVLNLGTCGADTKEEWRRLQEHPLEPDALVLQYYPNDIEGAAQQAGRQMPHFAPYQDLPPLLCRFLVRSSYLLNFVYWTFPHLDSLAYVRYLEAVLAEETIFGQHLQDLEQFITFSEQRRIPLVVVLFPTLNDLDHSRRLTSRLKQLFLDRKVPVVDVADLVVELPVGARTVNPHDAHASNRVHELVADAIAPLLTAR